MLDFRGWNGFILSISIDEIKMLYKFFMINTSKFLVFGQLADIDLKCRFKDRVGQNKSRFEMIDYKIACW